MLVLLPQIQQFGLYVTHSCCTSAEALVVRRVFLQDQANPAQLQQQEMSE